MVAVTLDPEICENARLSRDPRFDGRFFVAVVTTGIYCRPICPVPPPKSANVRFYASAAAAQEAGFRPCLRCRPEAAPGSAAWRGSSVTVQRALRLIDDGALDQGPVATLASRLGVGERYLRKLFAREIGASPNTVALTRRLHLAKQLLDGSPLPMAEIAAASGFASLRRFNAAFAASYGRPPSALRRAQPVTASGSGEIQLRLAVRPPFHWQQFVDHFRLRQLPAIEAITATSYQRTFRLGDHCGRFTLTLDQQALRLQVRASPVVLPPLVARVRRMFDVDADPELIEGWLSRDPLLAPLIATAPGQRLPTAFDPFEQAVRTIIGQQITVKAAVTICGRLVARLGEPLAEAVSDGPNLLFPTAAAIASGDLEGLGLPGRRIQTLRALASAVANGELLLDGSLDYPQLRAALCAIPGIGPWTADYIALRGCGEPDAFPVGDLGLLKAGIWQEQYPSQAELLAHAEQWRPWRAYAAVYLWHSYSHKLTTAQGGES